MNGKGLALSDIAYIGNFLFVNVKLKNYFYNMGGLQSL